MSCLDDGRERTWQAERERIPRIWHRLEEACVERLGDGVVKPVGMK